jgi:predicted nucleic acid-binding protein
MSAVVLDASALVPFVLPESESQRIRGALAEWVNSGTTIHVPSHFWLELVNVLARRHGLTGERILEAIREIEETSVETVELDRVLLVLVNDHVERYGLTAYDAVYLALARSLEARLVTFDRALRRAGAGILHPDFADDEPTPGGPSRLSEERPSDGSDRPVTWPRWSGAGDYLATLRRQVRDAAEA